MMFYLGKPQRTKVEQKFSAAAGLPPDTCWSLINERPVHWAQEIDLDDETIAEMRVVRHSHHVPGDNWFGSPLPSRISVCEESARERLHRAAFGSGRYDTLTYVSVPPRVLRELALAHAADRMEVDPDCPPSVQEAVAFVRDELLAIAESA